MSAIIRPSIYTMTEADRDRVIQVVKYTWQAVDIISMVELYMQLIAVW